MFQFGIFDTEEFALLRQGKETDLNNVRTSLFASFDEEEKGLSIVERKNRVGMKVT